MDICHKGITENSITNLRCNNQGFCFCYKRRFYDEVITLAIKTSFAELGRIRIGERFFYLAIPMRSHQVMQCDLWRNTIGKQHQEDDCQNMPYRNFFSQGVILLRCCKCKGFYITTIPTRFFCGFFRKCLPHFQHSSYLLSGQVL